MVREHTDQAIAKARDILEAEKIEGEKAFAIIQGLQSEGILPSGEH